MKTIFFILLLSPLLALAQYTHNIGSGSGTGSGGDNANWMFYNIKRYGAIGDSLTNETAAIQAATDACNAAGGGTVYWPAGQYSVGKITTYRNVRHLGDGKISTKIYALADTVFKLNNIGNVTANVPLWDHTNTLFEEMYIKGTNAALVGISLDHVANFHMRRVLLHNFLNGTAIVMANTLIGTLDEVYTVYTRYGLRAYKNSGFGTNHVRLSGCNFLASTKWGVDWSGGGMLVMDHCDLEVNGTPGDTLSGGVYYHDEIWAKGLVMKNCWMEENKGGRDVWIHSDAASIHNYPTYTTHEIAFCNLQGNASNTLKSNIYVSGTNHRVNFYGGTIFGATSFNNIVIDGSNNSVKSWGTTFDNSSANIIRGTGNTITNN